MAEIDDIINTLIAEAAGEGPEGMRRVAETIINRAAVRGQSFGDVVRAPAQYTGYWSPGADAVAAQQSPAARAEAQAAWDLAMQPGDPTGGADHYINPRLASPDWANKLPTTGDYGNHRFFSSRPIPPAALNDVGVGTLTDTVPPRAPSQVTPMPSSDKMIAQTFGSLQKSAPSFADLLSTIAPRSVTPSLKINGNGISDPVGIVYGKEMTTSLNPPVSAQPKTTGIGAPPSTRSVQSVPMPALAKPASAPATRTIDQIASLYAGGGPTRPTLNQIGYASPANPFNPGRNAPDRLASGKYPDETTLVAGGPDNFNPYGLAMPEALDVVAKGSVPLPKARPSTRTVSQQVINPAWTAAQQKPKIDPVGAMPSWGDFADKFAPKKPAAAVAQPPKFITVKKQVPVAAPVIRAPAAQPARAPLEVLVQGSNTAKPVSAVAALKSQGLSDAQAYEAANAQAAERARKNATQAAHVSANSYFNDVTSGRSGSSTRGDSAGGAQPRGTMF